MKHDIHDYDHARPNGRLLMGLVAGAAVGGGLALLFAPRQGADMRHDLATGAQRAGRRLRDGYETVADNVRQRARQLADQTQDLQERAHDTAESVQESVSESVDAAASSFESVPSRRVPNGMGTSRSPIG